YHQILPRPDRIDGVSHSYFDGEADGTDSLPSREGGGFEDVVPILARGWGSTYLGPGQSRAVPFLPRLLRARLEHQKLAWGRATISRSAANTSVKGPAGSVGGSGCAV